MAEINPEWVEKAARAIYECEPWVRTSGGEVPWSDLEDFMIAKKQAVQKATAALSSVIPDIQAEERERCAKIAAGFVQNADDWDSSYWDQCADRIASAIRTSTRETEGEKR